MKTIETIGSIWFTEFGSVKVIGIVRCFNKKINEEQAYIGTGNGLNQSVDEDKIIECGAKFPLSVAKILIPG